MDANELVENPLSAAPAHFGVSMIAARRLMKRDGGTRIFFVRHGDTIDEETKKVYKGSIDIPLSDRGRQRIARASEFLSRFKMDFIYTSALSRCIESGKIIAEKQGVSIETESALNELGFGLWEGMSFDEIRERYPREIELWLKDFETHTPPQGEPMRDAQQRSVAKFKEIADKHRGQNIVIVCHAGILRLIICSILDLKLSGMFRISQDYGCIDMVRVYKDNIAVVELLNFTQY
jgi:alpha-ribazole phosphatase